MASDNNNQPITFVVPGRRQAATTTRGRVGDGGAAAPAAGFPGQVKASVQVGALRSGGAPERLVAVPGEDVVALHIAGGPVLYLHPANARDLMLAQGNASRGGPAAAATEVAVPVQLRWAGLEQAAPARTRGFLGDVVLSALEVLTGFVKDQAVLLVAGEVVKRADGQVDAGVYVLAPEALASLKGSGRKLAQVPASGEPMLVLVHGTFTDSASTFAQLWKEHPQRVRELFTQYGGRVYALDHPTMGASPVANALTLVQALPQGARLHLATHSRGGLVAEVLARVASQRDIGDADLAFFPSSTHADARRELQDLAAAVRAKDIRVERVVRVACPARGTLLASGRLDAYLSVLKWTLELAGLPVAPTLMDFICEVARRRADPAQIPGIEAMMPGTPLINWLNAAPAGIAGDLRVVAGDLEGDSVGSWLKTLLADSYYWTDNDIVVQTRSMYGGAPRLGGASFLLDRGGQVSHFAYFGNQRTADAFVDALLQAQPPAGFRTIGLLSWQGQDSGGERGGPGVAPGSDGARPAVFVLPGIMGSNLAVAGERVWLSLRLLGGLSRIQYQPGAEDVTADGAIGPIYGDLIKYLAASHDVVEFGFDWRRPIEEEARRLASAVDQALAARQASGQPVRILAHSMGGLLARTMWLERPATWQRLLAHPDARLLMLGTPNGGSWAPMQVLSGDDTLGNTLAALGSPLADQAARQLMAGLPGLLQLQAGLTDPALALDKSETWARLADDDRQQMLQKNWWHNSAGEAQEPVYRWGVPTQAVLDQARALRLRLDAQLGDEFKAWAGRILLVVGAAKFTPDGFETGDQGFVYRNAVDGGDGRVPLTSALLPGVATWKLACDHSELPSEQRAFDAYVELLTQGSTTRLEALAATRGGPAAATVVHVLARPARERPSARPAESERDVLRLADDGGDGSAGGADTLAGAAAATPLRLAVLNGNLTFVRQPLMIGHYRSLMLTGTEDVIDRHVGGAMRVALAAGLYPELPGSSRIFVNTRRRPDDPFLPPRPQAAIVVGLGDEGNLSTQQLVTTVRQGVIAWAQRAAENAANDGSGASAAAGEIEIAATLLGSGGLGINAGGAARAIAQGVREANQRLAGSGWPRVGQLTLVELYLDRAAEAWRGLQMLATASPQQYRVAPTIAAGTGPLRRQMDNGYRGTGYDLISATSGADGNSIAFALDTRRARTEVRAQSTQRKLLTDLLRQAATANASDPQIGSTLFQLLVPAELEPFMAGEDSVVLELDSGTAPIPWELLEAGAAVDTGADDSGERPRPWAIRTRLLRRLRKANFRPAPQDASADDCVLVIGEPFIAEGQGYPRLPGARAEAEAVATRLTGMDGLPAERVVALFDQPEAATVINALLAHRYRIVHIAGHGEPVERDAAGKPLRTRGVVLSGDVFLGAVEIKAMRTVPELVFINCCHLGGHDASEALRDDDPSAFAATVADALIEIGVRCVVAAGWAVGDAAAEAFASTFYRELLQANPFIDAVHLARIAAWQAEPDGKTWAAYQCYGDPNWVLRGRVGDAQAASSAPPDAAISIASPPGLALALEEITVRLLYMGADKQAEQDVLLALEQRFAADWGGMGAVAEAFAVAWAAADRRDQAIAWYERALQAEDASASIKVQEQLGNLRVRAAWAQGRQARPGTAAFREACAAIALARQGLQALADGQPTVERLSLCGSAAKRLAMLHARGSDAEACQRERQATHAAYADAEALARTRAPAKLFYPGLNRIAAELVLLGPRHALDAAASEAVRQSLLQASADGPNFWTEAARAEFEWLAAVAEQRLAASLAAVRGAYMELHLRVDARGSWQSVCDQAEFVLGAYRAGASAAERAAADALLELLGGYAN